MRVVVQKVSRAAVSVTGAENSSADIGTGLLLLVGVADSDGPQEVAWMAHKLANLRIFEDVAGKLNLSVTDVGGSVLSVSQFTLFGDVRRGNRPSFVAAGEPSHAKRLWEELTTTLSRDHGLAVKTGVFGAHMEVELVNDGPVTLLIDTERDMPQR